MSDLEKVSGKSVSTPLCSLPLELQNALGVGNVRLHEDAIQRASELIFYNVKYGVKDVFFN